MFGSRFLNDGLADLERVYCFINNGSSASFAVVQVIINFCFLTQKCFLTPKMRPNGRTVVNSVNKWLILILWKSAEAINSHIRSIIVPKSLYIVAGNDVIGCFRSTTNSDNTTGATANFSVRNIFWDEMPWRFALLGRLRQVSSFVR